MIFPNARVSAQRAPSLTEQPSLAEPPPEVGPEVTAAPPRHPAWRLVWSSCVVVPLVVLAPLLTQAPTSDQRLNVYGFGSAYLDRPWRLPVDAVGAVPHFLNVGNFRPLGRTYEWFLDVLVFGLIDLFGLPVNVGLRLVALAAAIVLTVSAVVFAACVTARGRAFAIAPSVPVALLPFAVGAGFVAAGPLSTTVLFGGLYFSTSALVLAVAAWACRVVGAGGRRWMLAVFAGAAIAAFNELAYLAVPLATVAVLARSRIMHDRPWRAIAQDAGVRFAAGLWAGFLPIVIPVRAVIQANCADGGCYDGSEAAVSGAAATVPSRLIAWLPPLMWRWATTGHDNWLTGPMLVLALAALLVPAIRLLRALPTLSVLDRRPAVTLAVVAAALLGLAAVMSSLNVWMQRHAALGHYGVGWREAALASVGGSTLVLALLALLALLAAPGRRGWLGVATLPLLVALAAASAAANREFHENSSAERLPYIHNRIAQEMADFDPTPDGDARRCTLRRQYLSTTAAANVPRIDAFLDGSARQIAGRRFCNEAPLPTRSQQLYLPAGG